MALPQIMLVVGLAFTLLVLVLAGFASVRLWRREVYRRRHTQAGIQGVSVRIALLLALPLATTVATFAGVAVLEGESLGFASIVLVVLPLVLATALSMRVNYTLRREVWRRNVTGRGSVPFLFGTVACTRCGSPSNPLEEVLLAPDESRNWACPRCGERNFLGPLPETKSSDTPRGEIEVPRHA